MQTTEWGSSAWRLGDPVHKGRSSLLCGSQHPNHYFQRPPHWKVLCVRTHFRIIYSSCVLYYNTCYQKPCQRLQFGQWPEELWSWELLASLREQVCYNHFLLGCSQCNVHTVHVELYLNGYISHCRNHRLWTYFYVKLLVILSVSAMRSR